MTDDDKTLRHLIAHTPAAQPLAQALAHIKARRERLLAPSPAAPETVFSEPEPLPAIDDPEAFAAKFWQRRSERKPKPAKPRPTKADKSKPLHLTIIDGDKTKE